MTTERYNVIQAAMNGDRQAIKVLTLAGEYKAGKDAFVENLVQVAAVQQSAEFANVLAKAKEAGLECIVYDGDFTDIETRTLNAMNDKFKMQRVSNGEQFKKHQPSNQRSIMAVVRAALSGAFPQHLLGGSAPKKPKAQYNKCKGCGNPTKSGAYCFTCQKKGK